LSDEPAADMRAELAMKTRQIAELSEALTNANRVCDRQATEIENLKTKITRILERHAALRFAWACCRHRQDAE
jgi:uncharacterized coiled-coil protein SlyX